MYTRTLSPGMKSVYGSTFDKKPVSRNIGRNLSTAVTTNSVHYTATPRSLYQTDVVDNVSNATYTRPKSFKMELVKLPDQYNSTIKPKLDPTAPTSTYQHCFGAIGQHAHVKRNEALKPRTLSKTTQADVAGTTRITHYPPGYSGHIPREWNGNRGKTPHEDRNLSDYTWQYHTQKTGYGGYVPSAGSDIDLSHQKKTMTTYREMCAAVHFDD